MKRMVCKGNITIPYDITIPTIPHELEGTTTVSKQ
jgi:hypothetical protein